MRFIAHQL